MRSAGWTARRAAPIIRVSIDRPNLLALMRLRPRPDPMLHRLPPWKLALAIVVLVVVTRLPAVGHRDSINDESYYSVVANELLHGGLLYRDAVDRKPPLLFGVYWGIYRVTGFPNWPALHLVAVGWTLATMALLYLLGRRLATPLAGVIAAVLYGAFLPFETLSNLAFNGEMLMNLPLVAAVLVAFRPNRRPLGLDMMLAGSLVALAFLLKQPAGIVLVPLAVYCLHPGYRRSRGFGALTAWWHAAALGLGFLLVMAEMAGLLHRWGILADAWYWSVIDHDIPHGPGSLFFWRAAARKGGLFFLFCGPLLVGAWYSLRFRAERWRGLEAERDALIALLLVSAVGTAASGRFFQHYFLQVMPPLALLAAPALAELWQSEDLVPSRRRLRRLLVGWTALSVLVSFVIEAYDGLLKPPAVRPAVAWLAAHAAPGDRLFVWGQDPRIYLATGTRPASRYIAAFPLTGYVFGIPESWDPNFDTSHRIAPGAWDTLAQDFRRHPPKYIVDTDAARRVPRYPILHFPYLAGLIETHYVLRFRGSDGLVYERRE